MNNLANEHVGQEYRDGPWASTTSDPLPDNDDDWHFPEPDVSSADEVSDPDIFIERCGQGFLVYVGQDKLAFSDAFDIAEWLLGWLGLDNEKVISIGNIPGGLLDPDREAIVGLARSAHGIHAEVAEDPPTVAECIAGVDYDELVGREAHSRYVHCMDWPAQWWEEDRDYKRALDVVGAAQAFIALEGRGPAFILSSSEYRGLVKAVKKWQVVTST